MEKIFHYKLADKDLKISIGKVAEQAGGSCLIQYGDTVVLAAATSSNQPREGIDFFPLSVDYEEKMYSVGKIPGGFIKREARPSEKAVLTSRLIDRPLRPLFPDGFRNDVQVITTVLSVDQEDSPEIIAMIGSSIALSISDIPFNGPTAAVLVGVVDGKFIINPNMEQRDKSELHLIVSGTEEAIMMVESGSNEVSEKTILEGILFAHEEIIKICKFIKEISLEVGKEKRTFTVAKPEEELEEKIISYGKDKLIDAINTVEKQARQENIDKIKEEILEMFLEDYPEDKKNILKVVDDLVKEEVRRLILEENIRPDSRSLGEVRKITSEVGLIPRTHGSGLFTRGQTQEIGRAHV